MAPSRVSPPSTPAREVKVNGGHTSSPSTTMSSPVTYKASFSYRSSMNGHSGGDSSSTYYIRNTAQSLEKKGAAELGFGVFESISKTTFINLVEYIGNERLSSLPHRGSTWDKVLIRALYFAERQHGFEKIMSSFGNDDTSAACLAYGYCKLLLELGHENASALDKAFSVLYQHALEVAALLHRAEILSTTVQIKEQLSLMYTDLLTLTSVVATRFYKVTQGIAASDTSLDIYDVCSDVIESFRDRKEKVIDLLWNHQAQVEGVDMHNGVNARTLDRWLVSMDPVQTTLTQDHTIQLAGQAEFTCLWFQKQLSSFVQGESRVMAITGAPGSGKSVLAASVVERLQRALGRKSFSTLYYSISADMPAATTPIAILKSLLAQIFNLRIGNMQTYHAIVRAYESCYSCADLKSYEDHLWEALDQTFKKPLENARDLIVVVDGLDEIHGGKSASQSFFERLADTVCDGKRVKLIGLAESLSMPSGMNSTHVTVSAQNVQEDIHSVLLRALARSHHVHHKSGTEQEQILDRIARAANGSFTWAILISQVLLDAKTSDEFTKAVDELEKAKPSVSDLVQRITTKQDLSTTTKTVLSLIINSERPLTVYDIQKLLTHGQKPASDSDTDVFAALQPLAPLLSASDYVKRFRHRSVQSSVTTLATSGKINIPEGTNPADILIRSLNYAKTVLRDDLSPSLDEYNSEAIARIFREHPLLPYVVRYWTVYLERLGANRPKDIAGVLPRTTMMPLIERLVWSLEVPLTHAVDLHKTASEIRRTILPQPSAPVLQSYINTATVYDLLDKTSESAPLYYWAAKLSHQLDFDVLSLELGQRYLHLSERFTESKRTETMTRREEVYQVIITLLIKEYGVGSSEVIHMRTLLAQFYEHMHEEKRATEIYESIHEATVHVHGKDSTQARGISDHLRVNLGRTKTEEKIETRNESLFDDTEDADAEEDLNLTMIADRLKTAKTERDFVELWRQTSTNARGTTAVEWHERNIDVATAYARYLSSNKRSSEASAVLSSISREYESHQASFSDQIVKRLSSTAGLLQEMGQYAAALSILRSTNSFYQSTKREETQQSAEVQRQISTIETDLIQSSSTETHGDMLERVYRNAIKDHTKPVDGKIVAIAKTLIVQYMDHYNPANAIEIVKLLLGRVWPSFLSAPTNEIEMTTTSPKETVELVIDYMIPCYTLLRQPTNAEWALSNLFSAALTARTVDFQLVNRIQTLLLEQYDKHNRQEKSIATLQRALPVRRSNLGTTHEDTVKTLYELGRRSRQRPRTYPGWIDFYQQIVSYLNKDNEISTPQAMEALIIVATTYWEDGRYDDAVFYYKVLWSTFTKQPKQHPRFSQAEFAQELYERYYSCLEQTSARVETLYQVTKQYRSSCITIFGAQSEMTTRATLSLARVSHTSEEHTSEALALYEEVSKHASGSIVHKSEVQSALKTLYTRQLSQTSTTVSSETIESARSRSLSEYEASTSKFGYSHQTALSHLHQLALLYYKQNKTEAITKELTKATTETIRKETSSRRLIEAAESIVETSRATKTTTYLENLIAELHRQIVCKDSSRTKTFGFDLTKYGRSTLPFLAAMMCKTSKDVHVSFSHTIAQLITEMMYFEEYRRLVKADESLHAILMSASSLRSFLIKINQQDAVSSLDKEVASIFVSRDGSKMKLLSQQSARIFMVAIMEYLGSHKNPNFIKGVVIASNDRIAKLMGTEQYAEAYDIANCAFEFALENEGYAGPRGLSYGFSLASNLAGIGYQKKCSDANLRKQMLQLSNSIAKKILETCKHQSIKFTEIQLTELNRLVELLGVQEDYDTLESLLTTLWNTREAHRDWSSSVLHNLGRDLIYARYLAGHPVKALRLCEDITYNLRRTNGATHAITREMNLLLAQLYTSVGESYIKQGNKDKANVDLANQYFAKAFAVHEEILRIVVGDSEDGDMGDDDDWDSTGKILAEHGISLRPQTNGNAQSEDEASVAKTHLRLLKLAYQRLGSWPGSHGDYEKLVNQVQGTFSGTKDIQTPDKWQIKGFGNGKAESNEGTFGKVESWQLMEV